MAIYFENVTYYYNKNKKKNCALKNINLKIEDKGEIIALLGKLGSGKSTLVQLMNGLLIPSEGNIEIFKNKIDSKTSSQNLIPLRRRIGLVFQFPEYQLFETTVLKDVMFAPKNFGKSDYEAKIKAIEVLKQVNIDEELFNSSPFQLSGGQQRKVAIAGILAMEPSILILDEPTRGLDIKNRNEIINILIKKNHNEKKTIIFITHDMDLVSEFANKVILLEKGEIVFFGCKKDFFLNEKIKYKNIERPETFKILKFLQEKINIPFEPKYSLKEIYQYLKKFFRGKK
ncbi:ATP-binding cassette domain-containing protein [Texas Phoenix palm phytoplasma]|uniref:ATP-binding cassette domain-containing protein n=1 Tax=Texas Phoenix palm phytoplasma TaxID=176709 RepID=A0ABS5BII8_9MOLU|nr:ATP-binding cassette domain-containing protein [Texas Phoenix palm phytoplasma]MBP3059390.1 ATP-binding cassette domain-containing protein [Texas Phoenix palm phytoplasma]